MGETKRGSPLKIIFSCFCFCSNGATLHLFWNSGEGRNCNCSPVLANFPFPEFPLFTIKKNLFRFRSHAPFPEKLFFATCGSFCVCERRESGSPHYIRIDTWLLSARLGVFLAEKKKKKATCRNCQWQHTLTLRKCTRRRKIINSRSETARRQTFPTNFLCLKSGLFS